MAETPAPRVLERIVLGTVQLGLPYGGRAGAGVLAQEAAFAILDAAWEAGIRAFDTAEAYGEAPARLAAWLRDRGIAGEAEVVTKVRPGEGSGIGARAEAALARFRDVASRVLLTHGAAAGAEWEAVLAATRAAGAAAGQSVYGPEEVAAAVAMEGVARVQAPGNLFDLRALQARGAAEVALDLRSIYLQGVLAEAPAAAEARVAGGGALARAVRAAAAPEEPAVMLCAAMLRAGRAGDRLVIGVDAPEQLAAVTRAAAVEPERVERFVLAARAAVPEPLEPRVLDPRRW